MWLLGRGEGSFIQIKFTWTALQLMQREPCLLGGRKDSGFTRNPCLSFTLCYRPHTHSQRLAAHPPQHWCLQHGLGLGHHAKQPCVSVGNPLCVCFCGKPTVGRPLLQGRGGSLPSLNLSWGSMPSDGCKVKRKELSSPWHFLEGTLERLQQTVLRKCYFNGSLFQISF